MQRTWRTALCALLAGRHVFADVQFREPASGLTLDLVSLSDATATDLDITLTVPISYGWGAIGTGSQMSGSLMFVLLPNGSDNSTISVRSANGHNMPTTFSGVDFQLNTTMRNSSALQAQGTCKNCGSYLVSTTDQTQPFIWAVGPGTSGVEGTGASANIEQHNSYGTFSANMTQAAQRDTVFQAAGSAAPDGGLVAFHAILLVAAFFVVMPLAVILLRLTRFGFKVHWMLQALALTGSLVGLGVAIYMCAITTKFRSFSEGHQILGIALVALLIPQAFLGRAHHVNFKKSGQRSLVSHVHRWSGRVLIPLGVLNAVTGCLLEPSTGKAVGAGIVGTIICIATYTFVFFSARRKDRSQDPNAGMEWYRLGSSNASRDDQTSYAPPYHGSRPSGPNQMNPATQDPNQTGYPPAYPAGEHLRPYPTNPLMHDPNVYPSVHHGNFPQGN